ncbi:hypothetical protein [Nannocystis pusilla]|uniref:hypothetical protein n=1 Tax=Nannocystis pusilla TaxID=889268 RepID=UPI003DA3C3DC
MRRFDRAAVLDRHGGPARRRDGDPVGQTGPSLLLFGRVGRRPDYDDDVADELAYAAYVVLDSEDVDGLAPDLEQWRGGEAVTSGHVRTENALFIGCRGDSWAAEGTFVWRATTIELRWAAGNAC